MPKVLIHFAATQSAQILHPNAVWNRAFPLPAVMRPGSQQTHSRMWVSERWCLRLPQWAIQTALVRDDGLRAHRRAFQAHRSLAEVVDDAVQVDGLHLLRGDVPGRAVVEGWLLDVRKQLGVHDLGLRHKRRLG